MMQNPESPRLTLNSQYSHILLLRASSAISLGTTKMPSWDNVLLSIQVSSLMCVLQKNLGSAVWFSERKICKLISLSGGHGGALALLASFPSRLLLLCGRRGCLSGGRVWQKVLSDHTEPTLHMHAGLLPVMMCRWSLDWPFCARGCVHLSSSGRSVSELLWLLLWVHVLQPWLKKQ